MERDTGVFTGLSALQAVILYDEAESQGRARQLFERLASDGVLRLPFAVKWCRLDFLESLAEAEAALTQAREADLLVIAFQQGGLPTRPVIGWLEAWAVGHKKPAPALALLPQEAMSKEASKSAEFQTLRTWAAWHGLDCFESWNLRTGLAWKSISADSGEAPPTGESRTGTTSPAGPDRWAGRSGGGAPSGRALPWRTDRSGREAQALMPARQAA